MAFEICHDLWVLVFLVPKTQAIQSKTLDYFALFNIAITISQRITFKSLVNSSVVPWQDITSVKSSHKFSGY